MKICNNCGFKNDMDAKFCINCGETLIHKTEEKKYSLKSTVNMKRSENRIRKVGINNGKLVKYIFIIVLLFLGGWYWNNRMPKGLDTTQEILKYTYSQMKGSIFIYGTYHINTIYENSIYVLQNDKTDRFVFKVEDNKTKKIHYCYLIQIGNDSNAVTDAIDISDKSYCRSVTKKAADATIIGNIKYHLAGGISVMGYSSKVGSIDQ